MDRDNALEGAQEEARGLSGLPPTGEYRIIGRIAEGKGTFLYRGEHRRSHYSVVIKTLKPSQRRSRVARRHMANEARVLREISHPCVVRLLSFRGRGRYPYLVLEYVNGHNVKGWNIRRDKTDVVTPVKVMQRLAEGLLAVHRAGFIHLDIKPENMIAAESGDVRIIDFALARRREWHLADLIPIRFRVQGTRSYMSPEQIRGRRLDHRSDIYSFGCALYEIVSGKPPFSGVEEARVLHQHLRARPRSLRHVLLDIDPELDGLIQTMLEKDPHDRPQSMEHVVSVLAGIKSLRAPEEADAETDQDDEQSDEDT